MDEVINILVIEDDEYDREIIKKAIQATGEKNFKLFSDADKFRGGITGGMHLFIIDHKLGGATGLDLMMGIKSKSENYFFILFTGYKDIDVIIKYNNIGAHRIVGKWQPDAVECLTNFIKEGIDFIKNNIETVKILKSLKSVKT